MLTNRANAQIAEKELEPEVDDALTAALRVLTEPTLVVLPARIDAEGGVYSDHLISSVKELRRNDVAARFLHDDPRQRRFLSEFSADIPASIALGVASNMTWDSAVLVGQWLLTLVRARTRPSGSDPNMRITIARLRNDRVRVDGLEIYGPASVAAEALARVLAGDDPRES